jgi:hypothetical protein
VPRARHSKARWQHDRRTANRLGSHRLLRAPSPTKDEIDAAELAVAALIYAEDFTPGGKAQTKYLALSEKFIAKHVAQHERVDAFLPADLREGKLQ